MQAKSGRNNGPFHWLEKRLWRSGVQDPTIREILCWQISVIALSLLFGAVLWPFHPAGAWIFWFGFGALLSAWNFFALIKFVPKVMSMKQVLLYYPVHHGASSNPRFPLPE